MSPGRFEFRLERVRALRERTEEEATEHLAAAMAERSRLARRLADAAEKVVAARSAQLTLAGSAPAIADMHAHQAFIERTEREQAAAELELSRQDAEVDARRLALQRAAQERQVLEQLKDKQATAHRRAAERRENEKLDELALAGFTRRGSA